MPLDIKPHVTSIDGPVGLKVEVTDDNGNHIYDIVETPVICRACNRIRPVVAFHVAGSWSFTNCLSCGFVQLSAG